MLELSLRLTRNLVMVGVLITVVIVPIQAGSPGSIEGVLIGADGRLADTFQVVLVSDSGEELGASVVGPEGRFLFDPVQAGSYGLGVRDVKGQAAPVMAAPIQVDGSRIVRNIRLRTSPGPVSLAPASGGLGVWWAGLSPAAKVWTVTGGLVITGLTFGIVDEDDGPGSGESPATPTEPF